MKIEWNPLLTDMGDVIVKLMPQQDMASQKVAEKTKSDTKKVKEKQEAEKKRLAERSATILS